MNRLYQREKRLIFEDIPNNSNSNVYGFTPTIIQIEGVYVYKENGSLYITHQNAITYTQRVVVNITLVGEIKDLLSE